MYQYIKSSQYMKKHSYISDVKPTDEQLLLSTTDAWLTYSENILKQPKSVPYVKWKCISCGKEIYVHYKSNRLRDLYCAKCRPRIVRKNGVLMRYMIMFKNHINAIIRIHSGISNVIDKV